MEIDKVPAIGNPALNNSTDKETKNKPLKEHLSDSGWAGIIRNWIVGLVVIAWGGQGIYDRNFNDKVGESEERKKLIDENISLQKRITNLEEKLRKQ